ncbi:hypothetical protein VNO80_30375 [Phaseolus coccineus]|uniref:Uncharacterized protein n=1 Tax=Phaseolus coccineus TaxID=3886 RepID=A0AAN9LCT6_PHACN
MKVSNFQATATTAYRSFTTGIEKTLLLKEIIKFLNRLYAPSGVYVTTSTGVATFALKAQTLHCFAGIAILTDVNPTICWRRFCPIRMLAGGGERCVDETWGGIQLVVCGGDCFQMPLVVELTRVFRLSDYELVRCGESKCGKAEKFAEGCCSLYLRYGIGSDEVSLCEGARVMVKKHGLANGAIGVVVRNEIPPIVAWAISIQPKDIETLRWWVGRERKRFVCVERERHLCCVVSHNRHTCSLFFQPPTAERGTKKLLIVNHCEEKK